MARYRTNMAELLKKVHEDGHEDGRWGWRWSKWTELAKPAE